ncbi:M23 family metallopeptidase [Microbacterium paraoxydans]|uniref:M23 family metallopeptidase n=1 Tax=Microbacterium paraoxydans TaxID=199592 RepID=UPI003D7550FE
MVGTLTVASSFMVGMTIPAETIAAARTDTTARFAPSESDGSAADSDIQAFVVPEDAAAEDLGRSNGFSVTSVPQLAAAAGIRYFSGSLLLDPDAEVQWPFPVSVPTSSSFGPRWGRMHEGADFTPGEGAQIRAVAGGTVRIATENGGAFGVTVYIESKIDGQTVFSRYAHMLRGSLGVREGESVSVGEVVGRVGNTGRSFGAHLHLEVSTGDGTVDPVAWLREQTGE